MAKIICKHPDVLDIFLRKLNPMAVDDKPNGQVIYRFKDGLDFSLYNTTGAVQFQGVAESNTAHLVKEQIELLNKA